MKRWAGGLAATWMMFASADALADEAVLVVMRAPPDTSLEVRDRAGRWRRVCNAPCGERVVRHAMVRVRGAGTDAQKPLVLGDEDEITIVIEERPSSTPQTARKVVIAGAITLAGGIGLFAGGLGLFLADAGHGYPLTAGELVGTLMITADIGGLVWAAASKTTPVMTVVTW